MEMVWEKSGIAITFDMSNIEFKYYDVKKDELPVMDTLTKPLPVRYFENEKSTYFSEIAKLCEEQHLNQNSELFYSSLFIPFCKDESFKEEKESRLIFYSVDGTSAGIKPFDIKYIPSGNILKPTLKVCFQAIDESKGIIKKLTVGPGQDQELIYNALVHILGGRVSSAEEDKQTDGDGAVELRGVTVQKSRIPFRG